VTGRRKLQPKPQRKPPAPAPAAASEVDPLADARIRPFVERYCDLAGVKLLDKGADLRELKLPLAERAHFQGRASLRVALSLDALERMHDRLDLVPAHLLGPAPLVQRSDGALRLRIGVVG